MTSAAFSCAMGCKITNSPRHIRSPALASNAASSSTRVPSARLKSRVPSAPVSAASASLTKATRFVGVSGVTKPLSCSAISYRLPPAKCPGGDDRRNTHQKSRHAAALTWLTFIHGRSWIGVSADTRLAALRSLGSAMFSISASFTLR